MNSKTISNGILKSIGFLVSITLLLLFLNQIRTVIVYLIIALILTLIGTPIQSFLKRRLKFRNTLATVVTILVFILIIAGFVMLFVPLILSQGENLSLLNTGAIEKNIQLLMSEFTVFLENHRIDSAALLKKSNLISSLDLNIVPNFLNTILTTISSFGIGFGCILFITFFFLKDKIMFFEVIKKIIPDQHEEKILNSIDKINKMLSRYFIGLLIQLFLIFILYLIVLLVFGVQNAFIIAFLCGVLNIIPYVGPLIGALFASILTMISNLSGNFQSETLPKSVYIFIGFIIIHLIDSNISQPIIFSKSVKSHPLEIFLVILMAGFIFGIAGMIIAIPLYTMLKVIAKEFLPENKIIQEITKNI